MRRWPRVYEAATEAIDIIPPAEVDAVVDAALDGSAAPDAAPDAAADADAEATAGGVIPGGQALSAAAVIREAMLAKISPWKGSTASQYRRPVSPRGKKIARCS